MRRSVLVVAAALALTGSTAGILLTVAGASGSAAEAPRGSTPPARFDLPAFALRDAINGEAIESSAWFFVLSSPDSGSSDSHSAPVQVYDVRGRWLSTLPPSVVLTPENLVHDVRLALAGGG